MNISRLTVEPAKTYTLDQFINMKTSDEITYRNLSVLDKSHGLEILDHNIVRDYIDYLEDIGAITEVTLDDLQMNKYRYAPDLLAYDLYGSTQLDFFILMLNDMIDPKEFFHWRIKLVPATVVKEFFSTIYNAEKKYISISRENAGLLDTLGKNTAW